MPFTKGHTINNGRKWSDHTRKMVSDNRKGKGNPNYRGTLVTSFCKKCSKPFSYYPTANNANIFCSKICSDYKGDNAKYGAKHSRLYRKYGKADRCEACKEVKKQYDWANITGNYNSISLKNWLMLCRGCHLKFDRYGYKLKELGYVDIRQ